MSDNTVKILETIGEAEWDAFAPHPLQSFAWGEARQAHGLRVIRVGVFSNEKLTQVFQVTLHALPLGFSIGYVPQCDAPNETVLNFLKSYARAHRILFIKFEPHVGAAQIPSMLKVSSHPNFYSHTRLISLAGKTIEELRAGLEKKTRYNVGLAERAGVTVDEYVNDEGFAHFANLFFSTAERKNYGGHTRAYHETIWKNLAPKGMAKIFTATYQGDILAAYEVFCWKDTWYTPYSGTSMLHKEVKAKNFLLFKIIEKAKERGAATIDLWGTLPETLVGEASWAGFSSFKKGYGGSIVALPGSFDLVVYPTLYLFYGLMFKLRKWLRKS